MNRPLTFVLSLFAGFAESARAQQVPSAPIPPAQIERAAGERRTMTAFRIADGEAIAIDGRLDEAPWTRAVPAAGFVQQDPQNGQPATEQTEVRILYNNESLLHGRDLLRLRAGRSGSATSAAATSSSSPTIASCGISTPSTISSPAISSR